MRMVKSLRRGIVVMALAIAAAGGGGLVMWAAVPAPQQATDNKAAAIDLFNQAKDLFQQNKYAEAMRANDQALKLDPTNSNAILLKKILKSKVSDTGTTPEGPVVVGKPTLLTPQQVSQIRLQELGAADKQVRGSIDRKVLDDFWNNVLKKQQGVAMQLGAYDQFVDPGNFLGQVARFKQSGDQSYISKVQILSDPADMLPYKNAVHAFVLKNCATAMCHGGDKGGDFRLLLPTGGASDQLIYTNFFIMAMYTGKDGGRMINRDDPEMSLFLQYALPKELAKFSHPGSVTVRRFGNPNDAQFKQIAEWVKGLALPRPNYGVVYGGIGATTATAPATTTTTRAAK